MPELDLIDLWMVTGEKKLVGFSSLLIFKLEASAFGEPYANNWPITI